MRVGDLVRFKTTEHGETQVGLLLKYDKFMKIGEVMCGDRIYYVPGRFLETYIRGKK